MNDRRLTRTEARAIWRACTRIDQGGRLPVPSGPIVYLATADYNRLRQQYGEREPVLVRLEISDLIPGAEILRGSLERIWEARRLPGDRVRLELLTYNHKALK